jgi:hypothetical protein
MGLREDVAYQLTRELIRENTERIRRTRMLLAQQKLEQQAKSLERTYGENLAETDR